MVEAMSADRLVVFVHGLGEDADAQDARADALPDGFAALVIDVFGAETGESLSLSDAAAGTALETERPGAGSVRLCGLSPGAMIAPRFAVDYPDRVLEAGGRDMYQYLVNGVREGYRRFSIGSHLLSPSSVPMAWT
jgi:pimeloyl-ACP methyl ester carboxylesterase